MPIYITYIFNDEGEDIQKLIVDSLLIFILNETSLEN
jgi:hypothetical protein